MGRRRVASFLGSALTSALVAWLGARGAGRYLPSTYRPDVGGAGNRTAGRDIRKRNETALITAAVQ